LEMAKLGKELEEKKNLASVEEHMGKNVELRVEVAPVRVQEKGEEIEAGGLVDDRHYWERMVDEVAEQSSDD
uniref:Gag-pol polyprotein n=1 Tax=Haemonchus placei TaxID=6290 RepID=A0A0N4WFB7_HAEPC